MTEIERVAREIVLFSAGCDWAKATVEERIRAEDVARAIPKMAWFRREVRRARGRTVGYCDVTPKTLEEFDTLGLAKFSGTVSKRRRGDLFNARVVLIAPRGRRKK